MLSSMVDVKYGGWIQSWVTADLNQMLDGRTLQVNSLDQVAESGN